MNRMKPAGQTKIEAFFVERLQLYLLFFAYHADNSYLYTIKMYIMRLMKKIIYILVSVLCGSLSSCRSQKEAGITPKSDNPYLTHYISAAPDSTGNNTYPSPEIYKLGQQKDVNPNKKPDPPLGDLLHQILESIFSKNH